MACGAFSFTVKKAAAAVELTVAHPVAAAAKRVTVNKLCHDANGAFSTRFSTEAVI